MTLYCKIGLFLGGALFGSAGLKLLGSRDAKALYAHTVAAYLRCKDQVMQSVEAVQDGCADVLADAKAINERRAQEAEPAVIPDASEA